MGTLDVVYRLLGVNETLGNMCDDVRDAMMALESERDAAVRRAESAESALATARVVGALAAQVAFGAGALWADREIAADTLNTPMAEAEARRRYPAPPRASEGERVCKCGHAKSDHSSSGTGGCCEFIHKALCPCEAFRPAVAPEPPQRVVPWRISVQEVSSPDGAACQFVEITPADARRIVSLAAQDGGRD